MSNYILVVNLNFALATMSMSSEENKSSAIRFGEREVGDSDSRPTKTAAAARHAQFELGDYNDSARDEESDETADVYGSVPSDKRDMMRMGKEQELRVCLFWWLSSCLGLALTFVRTESLPTGLALVFYCYLDGDLGICSHGLYARSCRRWPCWFVLELYLGHDWIRIHHRKSG